MIKAIIFDFHDTVITNGLRFIFKDFEVLALRSEIWEPFWRGKITEEEFWQTLAADIGEDKKWIEESKSIYYSKSTPVEGILPLARELKGKYKLALLANCPKPWVDDAVFRFNLDNIFDVLVSSGETGFLKPEKEIYLLTCQKLGVLPRQCLYIDDDQGKLKIAQDLGMKGIWFKSPKQLADKLKREGILD